jgi:hypothetical protein
MRVFLGRAWSAGIIPFWNPHLFCGYPVIEVIQTALLYPPNGVFLGVSPVRALAWLTTSHLLLNYLLTFLVLWRAFRFRFSTAAVAAALPNVAAVYPYRFFAGHLTILFAIPWMSAYIGANYRLATGRKLEPLWWCLSAAALALLWTSGTPQYAVYGTVAGLAVGLATMESPSRCMPIVTSFVVGVLMALPQIAITSEYIPYSARSGSWVGLDVGGGVNSVLLDMIAPAPFGNGVWEAHINERGQWDISGYMGMAALVSAVTGLAVSLRRWRSDRRLRAAVALVVLAIYLFENGPMPGLQRMREFQRAVVVLHFGLLLGVAMLLDRISPAGGGLRRTRVQWVLPAALVLWAIGILVLKTHTITHPHEVWHFLQQHCLGHSIMTGKSLEWESDFVRQTMIRSCQQAVGWGCVAACAAVLMRLLPRTGWLAFAAVLLLDPFLANRFGYVQRTAVENMGFPTNIERELHDIVSRHRNAKEPPGRWRFPTSLTNAAETCEGLLDADGYDPLMPQLALARRPWAVRQLPKAERAKMIALTLGIEGGIVEPYAQPEFVPPRQRIMRIEHENSDGAPSVATLSTCFDLQPELYQFGPIEDTTHTVATRAELHAVRQWLGQEGDGVRSPRGNPPAGRIVWYSSRNPNEVRMCVSSPEPAVVIVRSTWLPGWRAYTGASAAPVRPLRCNGWMIGVPVAAGSSMVRLSYAPPAWRVCIFVALAACCVWCLMLAGAAGTGRRQVRADAVSSPTA